jgi:transcriptional regulator with XRE-family HTH domain
METIKCKYLRLTKKLARSCKTLLAIKSGTANPTISTLEKLAKALEVA